MNVYDPIPDMNEHYDRIARRAAQLLGADNLVHDPVWGGYTCTYGGIPACLLVLNGTNLHVAYVSCNDTNKFLVEATIVTADANEANWWLTDYRSGITL